VVEKFDELPIDIQQEYLSKAKFLIENSYIEEDILALAIKIYNSHHIL